MSIRNRLVWGKITREDNKELNKTLPKKEARGIIRKRNIWNRDFRKKKD